MTPIGKQLALDSCTTFAVGDHVSAKLALDNIVYEKENVRRKAIVLSKQELFDCVERQGQSMLFRYAYKHIVKEGLHLECHYPYLAVADQVCQCPSLLDKRKVGISGWRYLDNETLIIAELRKQPLTASVLVYDSLILHKGLDVWSPEEEEEPHLNDNDRPVRHAVLLTGFGVDENGIEYYTAKGSWGLHRWLNGYIRIRRDLISWACMINGDAYWCDLAGPSGATLA